MFGQGELAARRAQAIDDFDGDDIGGSNGFLAGRSVPMNDGVEIEHVPEPASEVNIAEASSIRPGNVFDVDSDDIGVVG